MFWLRPADPEPCTVFLGPDQDELAYPAHHMVLETASRIQAELSSGTMIPQMTVVADLKTTHVFP